MITAPWDVVSEREEAIPLAERALVAGAHLGDCMEGGFSAVDPFVPVFTFR
jgi:hypothetical protein